MEGLKRFYQLSKNMEPLEIDPQLTTNNLHGLVFFTGLDLVGINTHHNTIFNVFTETKREKTVQINYKILTGDNELFDDSRRATTEQEQFEKPNSPAISRTNFGIIKCRWLKKYLENRPALIVAFMDLDWNSNSWFEKRTECESKINSLRQSIGQREIRLALILLQQHKTSLNDPIAAEKAMEICQYCRISSKHLFVFPILSDLKSIYDYVARLEIAFNEIVQDAYQACFKRIRARNVPNNDQQLLLRQQFKLAFLSELRQDRHSAFRYYKQSYQICAELDTSDVDLYEILSIASLLNFKICELNFLLNSPLEALNQFRKHSINFFGREPGFYPSKELAIIEMYWWKSQQCRQFADLFNRAVGNSLAAYASQNPGRFLEEAGSNYKKANLQIRRLKQNLNRADQPNRQTPPLISDRTDPLNIFDLNAPTLYYGQRPWKTPSTIGRASSEPINRPSIAGLSPIIGNSQLVEHAAKLFLERNLCENYAHSIQLFTMAIAQFKRYHCDRFVTMAYLDIADESISSRQFAKAIQIIHHILGELSTSSFRTFTRDVLTKAANCAFCLCNLNEYVWFLAQLLHSELWEKNDSTMADEIDQESWMVEAQKFLSGECRMPFPIPQKDLLFSREDIEMARQNCHQMAQSQQQQSFQLDLSKFGRNAFLDCRMHFLTTSTHNAVPIIYANETVPIEVVLNNNSPIPFNFNRCSLYFEQYSAVSANKTIFELSKWQCENKKEVNGQIEIPSNGESIRLLFLLKPRLGEVDNIQQQNRTQSPTSANKRHELEISIRRFSILSTNGILLWEIDSSEKDSRMHDLAIQVLPQIKKFHISGPIDNKIQLFTDESIECLFTLNNNSKDDCENLRNVRVLCQKIYREEEQINQPQNIVVQHTFNAVNPIDLNMNPTFGHQTLLPVYSQEVATFLGQRESTDFAVRLQSKSKNCVSLQLNVYGILSSDGEPIEYMENFPVFCTEPYTIQTELFCENGENAQGLIGGQRYRILISIEPKDSVTIMDIQWKLNTPQVEICTQKSLSEFLAAQFDKLLLAEPKDKNIRIVETWIQVANIAPNNEQLTLGDVIIEWKSVNSCEPIRSLVNIGQFPFILSPIGIQVSLSSGIGSENQNCEGQNMEEFFEVGRPFCLQYCLWNSLTFKKMPLAIQIGFDQIEGLIFSGIKEDYLTLFPDEDPHKFVQTFIPLTPGELQFPKPYIYCTNSLPGKPPMGLNNEELDRLNRQISTHTFKGLPKAILVMYSWRADYQNITQTSNYGDDIFAHMKKMP